MACIARFYVLVISCEKFYQAEIKNTRIGGRPGNEATKAFDVFVICYISHTFLTTYSLLAIFFVVLIFSTIPHKSIQQRVQLLHSENDSMELP